MLVIGEERFYSTGRREECVPFASVVNHKLENPVSVWCSEGNRVFSWGVRDGGKGSSDMGVQHGELQLKV